MYLLTICVLIDRVNIGIDQENAGASGHEVSTYASLGEVLCYDIRPHAGCLVVVLIFT